MALLNTILLCPECKKRGTREHYPWRCECGEPFILSGEVHIQFDDIKNLPKNFWRFRDVLPIKEVPPELTGLGGWTDLTPVEIDNRTVYVKQDYQLPSGSFKDRGASVMAAHVKETGISEVVEDTSGNAGVALSYYAGKLGITCHIYSTTTINPIKEKKIIENGAVLHKVSADRQAVTDETLRQVQEKYYASHTYNPYFLHGTKSIAYEIFEQFNYRVPDAVIVPVGNGTLILGLDLGFRELKLMNYCTTIPKLVGVQAAARCPIVSHYDNSISPADGEKKHCGRNRRCLSAANQADTAGSKGIRGKDARSFKC